MDANVKIESVKSATGLNPITSLPTDNKIITYTVGTHGPFTLTVTAAEYTAELVEQAIARNVAVLRAINAIAG